MAERVSLNISFRYWDYLTFQCKFKKKMRQSWDKESFLFQFLVYTNKVFGGGRNYYLGSRLGPMIYFHCCSMDRVCYMGALILTKQKFLPSPLGQLPSAACLLAPAA